MEFARSANSQSNCRFAAIAKTPQVIAALRLLLTLLLLPMATGLFAQTVRQNETASFNAIKPALDERQIEYTERDLLAEYGVFGKSIFTGGAATEEYPFLFVFPVLDCYRDLALSLAEHTAAGETKASVIFLGDAWSASNASLTDLLQSLDNPQNAALMYFTIAEHTIENTTENTTPPFFAVTFFSVTSFTETVKNPFHLTGVFARYLEAHNIRFSFHDKDIILAADAFPAISDINETAALLLDFAAASPPPETSPDLYYIAADLNGRKIILGNTVIIKIVLLGSAGFLFVILFFAVIFNKKRVLAIMLSAFFIGAAALILNNPLRSRQDGATAHDIQNSASESQENGSTTGETPGVEVKRAVFLDRIIYTIKAAYDSEPQYIAIFYDTENARMPGEVYESPFPYEIDEGRVTFTLGEYPPNPLETEISFPRAFPGLLTIAATYRHGVEPASTVWTEQPE
jgi:hypothetical protein